MSNKVSKSFQDTIKAYLDKRAQEDSLFAQSYAKEGKSIEECCNFIIQEVQKMKVAGLADDEVYGLAVHYYDEDDLGEIKASNCKVVVNHTVELTEEEKAQARKDAIAQLQKEEVARLKAEEKEKEDKEKEKAKKKAPAKAPAESAFDSPSLFDFGDEAEE
ncbi:MAG: PcfK-like family protein [Lachnospiraceae bacterium]|nr:PcfK-like family protein [Lachnospiraceae bacterium]